MKIPLWRHISCFVMIAALCILAFFEQRGIGETPVWFVAIGTAVVTQYIVEFFQNANAKKPEDNDVPPTP